MCTLKNASLKLIAFIGSILLCGLSSAENIKMRIAYPSGMNGQIPVVLEKTHIPVKHGIEAEYNFFQNGPPMMEALASGNVDVVITSLMPITSYLSKQPGKGVIVAQLGASSHALLVPKESNAKSIKDLYGKKIAVSFSTDSHLDLLALIKASGMDSTKDFNLVNTAPNELMLAISQGFSDAAVIRTPQSQRVQEQFGAKEIKVWPFRFAVLMRSDYLNQNPMAKAKLLDAFEDAIIHIANNRPQAAQWFADKLRMDQKIVLQATGIDPLFVKTQKTGDLSLKITPEFQKILEEWMNASLEFGLIKSKIDVAAAISK